MEVNQEKQDGVRIFAPSGRLDSATSPEFEKIMFEKIEEGDTRVVVDFTDLDYISSAGMRVILKATKDLSAKKGAIALCAMKDYVREVFEIAGFDSFITIVATRDEALSKV